MSEHCTSCGGSLRLRGFGPIDVTVTSTGELCRSCADEEVGGPCPF